MQIRNIFEFDCSYNRPTHGKISLGTQTTEVLCQVSLALEKSDVGDLQAVPMFYTSTINRASAVCEHWSFFSVHSQNRQLAGCEEIFVE